MNLGILILSSFLSGDVEEMQAYEECRAARRSTKIWKVAPEGAWLRVAVEPESHTVGLLSPGEPIHMLKIADRSGAALVKTKDGYKGFLSKEDYLMEVIPPRDTGSVKDCPVPSYFLVTPQIRMPLMVPEPDRNPELDELELDEPETSRSEGTRPSAP